MKNYYVDKTQAQFEDLDEKKQKVLLDWIKENFVPIKSTNYRTGTSYGLKHIIQMEDFKKNNYYTNEQFKKAMLLCGFIPGNPKQRSWYFNISSKSPAFKK